ncbi:MAG: bifunctional tRNA (5-methylaminomethyl-2-thiouridine)(34)-methyltransferase MnmD/FAD-dependent 5-carboxymethylaminomethyl-2-thiouridine(34) oxidoreductase MnmC [Azoarcus sp.]|jgi:tRNA 5-methylaminomethyl-2-thiouridine biosynthesis bifunctional protein|nr:bifunctional tRNA (5-methylaminomethyl-2-thiouridine)(34)-methyltransferase MnmD/FAD-dependent 5-carboxymethylaminomethyl-2-thiouridine(34) oxidoreductase MnmC [Azoarcus sp.]
MPLQPASLQFAADGTPFSEAYGDVYHAAEGGLGQARHVFLAGNGLPERWRGRERFVIAETGFGAGLNFLASWAAWREDAARPGALHFVSFELHPFRVEDLARLHAAWPELSPLADALRAHWPPLAGGMHRLHFDGERVCLTLYFGDVREGLAQLDACVDAIFLDGFSPAKNPEMWSAKVFHLLSRRAAPDATLATWSVAGAVREGLRRACFVTEKAPGFGGKREMLRGHLFPHPRRGDARPAPPAAHHAIVIGAGAAGSAVTARLAARGWTVDVIDAESGPGQGASGNHAGVLRPQPSFDDNRMSRLTRAGALYGWRYIGKALAAGGPLQAAACGVLHLARDAAQARKMASAAARLALPGELLRYVDAAEAGEIARWPVSFGGWYFPGCGWVRPPSLCAANLAAHPQYIRTHWMRRVAAIARRGERWHALADDGGTIAAAPVMILAAGTGLAGFAQAAPLPVIAARGQVSVLPAAPGSAPRAVVCCGGYVTPEVEGRRCAGASFDVDDADAHARLSDQQANLAKLEAILPGYTAGLDAAALGARVSFRPVSPDRLPMVGAIPAVEAAAPPASLAALPRHDGLYAVSGFGARGLAWAMLAGETLASRIAGDPLPLERELVEAMDPARFLLRRRRRWAANMTESDEG